MNSKEHNFGEHNSRRAFMQQIALCYMAAHLPLTFVGCSNEESLYEGSGKPPYKVWEEMLMALKTCPDYLEGRMKELVISKDPEAMFNFVRDELYLMPASPKALGPIGWQFKWGLKGALRYGMATPREKAELLNQMLTDAGFTSKVMYERTNITPEQAMTFFFRPIEKKYDIEVSKKQWKQWKKAMNVSGDFSNEIAYFDPDSSKSNALAERLWNLIPDKENLREASFDFRWDNYRTPTVQFEKEGGTFYAHLFDPKIPYGELRNDNGGAISPADPVKNNEEKVNISITYRDSVDTNSERELVTGEWAAADLVGNQINMAFMHGLSLEQQAITQIGSLRIFTPALAFQSFDEELQEMQESSYIGDPFTLEGKRIDLAGTEPKVNGVSIVTKPNENLQNQVKTLQVKAVPAHYPLVKLNVVPTDKNGVFVENLSANDFFITDNNNQIQPLMESNSPTPRVLMLYDTSLSMPKEYYLENMDAFIESLRKSILEKYPAAVITTWKTPSELFTWLLKASKTDYDLIIYATDGDNDDNFNPTDEKIYNNGPPAIILNVYDSDSDYSKETFGKMAELTNGVTIQAKDQVKTLDTVVDYIQKMEIPPYVFTYYAIGPTESHTAKVEIDNSRISESDTFNFISGLEKNDVGLNLIGVYCNIKIGNKAIRRVLAGWNPVTQRNLKPTRAHYLEVKSLILGGLTFYFEGEGPTFTTGLADLLKYKLSTRAWGEALLEEDLAKAKTEYSKGVFQYHPKISSLMAPLQDHVTASTFTFASGMRIGIYKQQLHIEDKKSISSFDFLPSSNYVTFVKDSSNAFKINLQKTAQLGIREASLFDNSTFSILKDADLIERTEAIASNWFNNLDSKSADYYYWYERLHRGSGSYKMFDPTKSSLAFWEVNPDGELYGILKDGTGGGGDEDIIQALSNMMDLMSTLTALIQQLGYLNPIGGLALSIVAMYGVTLTKLYAIVCETILIMDAKGMDDKIKAALKEFACNVAKAIIYASGGNAGAIMGGLDTFIALVVGSKSPLACK